MNRDEFFKRPTAKSEWTDEVLAGRDQEPGREGGTMARFSNQMKTYVENPTSMILDLR